MDLIAAGTVTTGNSVTITNRTGAWHVAILSAAQTTVKFGDNGPTITIPSTHDYFVEVPGDYQKITVNGASVSYMVFG
jgi:hypothetical protein